MRQIKKVSISVFMSGKKVVDLPPLTKPPYSMPMPGDDINVTDTAGGGSIPAVVKKVEVFATKLSETTLEWSVRTHVDAVGH